MLPHIHPPNRTPGKIKNTQTPGVTLFYWRADGSITRVSCWALRLAIKFRFLNIPLVLMFLFHLLTSGSSSRNEQSGKEIGFETFFPLELILGNSKTNTNTHQKWRNLWSSIKNKTRQNHLWLNAYKLTFKCPHFFSLKKIDWYDWVASNFYKHSMNVDFWGNITDTDQLADSCNTHQMNMPWRYQYSIWSSLCCHLVFRGHYLLML